MFSQWLTKLVQQKSSDYKKVAKDVTFVTF
ncbi:hypothetical protein M2451_001724 [Dysgonomonas sp. PFB1-18]|nr:hypothetical protein [Dysgonomonas sp. PF1-14]MDH6338967.1 hypothetical protein [Dysgonomonas sp. PF1-16]MDH6380402.1 hypothetical protein [Dysgonomonas sp. PFB1-18]MDH6397795.1 hypothetical protein [Dysgonomonas sp. PF1-23]